MARLLGRGVDEPDICPYLRDRPATLEHLVLTDESPEDLEKLLERGWRRFGLDHFRPRCAPCHECVPIRVPVDAFTPSRSQRRAFAKLRAQLDAQVGVPRIDAERLDLYRRWHAHREARRGWEPAVLNAESYTWTFAVPHPALREIAYRDRDSRLVAVGLVDEMPQSLSAVYFYYDPAFQRLSPGTAHVMILIEMARSKHLRHVYLGYYVAGCKSMQYKATFRPFELLTGAPLHDETARWESPVARSATGE